MPRTARYRAGPADITNEGRVTGRLTVLNPLGDRPGLRRAPP